MKLNNNLSKGCQLCQKGKWLCIFLTYRCNAGCHFCPAPFNDDRVYSDFGSKKEDILAYLTGNDFRGISFSGGDPFLVFDRLMDWLRYFKNRLPEYYYWVYTSGLPADKLKIRELAEAGMDEIRFNIAASGYISDTVWESIAEARKFFRYVSVEIPSIRKDFRLLKTALEKLEKSRVDYLNLHDYILTERDSLHNSDHLSKFVLNRITVLNYADSSVKNTEDILRIASEKGYHFHINHCSMEKKEIQMTRRRIMMAKVFNDPEYDMFLNDGTILNFHLIPDYIKTGNLQEMLPDPQFAKLLRSTLIKLRELNKPFNPGYKIIKASYIPQMNIYQEKILLKAEFMSLEPGSKEII